MNVPTISRSFVWRRLHSLFGLWIVIFLIEHLFTNSQAALLFGSDGMGFVKAVNFIKGLPYLQVVESTLIGVPILFHGVLGVKYLMTGKYNSMKSDGSKPALQYTRNRAYTWQRLTSWILLVGIIAHVGYMRFYKYPISLSRGEYSAYFVRLNMDTGLYTVAQRLDVSLFDEEMIQKAVASFEERRAERVGAFEDARKIEKYYHGLEGTEPTPFSMREEKILTKAQDFLLEEQWLEAVQKRSLKPGQVIAVSSDFGTVTLLSVRDSFKKPLIGLLYTIFVLAASFHAFNGLWTFLLTWGIIIKVRSQSKAINFCVTLMAIVAFLGLASIWGTYWITLRS